MSVYAELDNGSGTGGDIATNSGWVSFCAWARSLKDIAELRHLASYGWSQNLDRLETDLETAAKNATRDNRDVAIGLTNLLKARGNAEVVVVTDGTSGPDPAPSEAVPENLLRVFTPLLTEAYSRLLRVEADKAKRAANKKILPQHVKAFYGEDHVAFAASQLLPIFEAFLLASGRDTGQANDLARGAAILHSLGSKESLAKGVAAIDDWPKRAENQATDNLQTLLKMGPKCRALVPTQQPALTLNIPRQEPPVINVHVQQAEPAAPIVNVTLPEQKAPVVNLHQEAVNITLPAAAPVQPVFNVTMPEHPAPDVHITVPEQVINVMVPEQAPPVVNVAEPVINVMVPEQAPPTVNVAAAEAPVINVQVPEQAPPAVNITVPPPARKKAKKGPDGSWVIESENP